MMNYLSKLILFVLVATLFCSCGKVDSYDLQIVLTGPIGSKNTSSIPEDLYQLCFPLETSDTSYIPSVLLNRIDTGDTTTLQYNISGFGRKDNVNRIKRAIEEQIKHRSIGLAFAKPSPAVINISQSLESHLSQNSQDSVLVYLPKGGKFKLGNNEYKCFETVDALKNKIAEMNIRGVNKFLIVFKPMLPEQPMSPNCKVLMTKIKIELKNGDWAKADIHATNLVASGCEMDNLADSLITKGNEQFQLIKSSNSTQLISIPMGYFSVAFRLTSDTQLQGSAKKGYDDCLTWAKSKGVTIITLPSAP